MKSIERERERERERRGGLTSRAPSFDRRARRPRIPLI